MDMSPEEWPGFPMVKSESPAAYEAEFGGIWGGWRMDIPPAEWPGFATVKSESPVTICSIGMSGWEVLLM